MKKLKERAPFLQLRNFFEISMALAKQTKLQY